MFEQIEKWWKINVVKNWKTTLTGVFIGAMMFSVWRGWMDKETAMWMIASAGTYGFIIAKDGNKTGV